MDRKYFTPPEGELVRVVIDGQAFQNEKYPDSMVYPVTVGGSQYLLNASAGMNEKIKKLNPQVGVLFSIKKQGQKDGRYLPTLIYDASGNEVEGSKKGGGGGSRGMSPEQQANIEAQWAITNAVNFLDSSKSFWSDMKDMEKNQLVDEIAKRLWDHKQKMKAYILKQK